MTPSEPKESESTEHDFKLDMQSSKVKLRNTYSSDTGDARITALNKVALNPRKSSAGFFNLSRKIEEFIMMVYSRQVTSGF
jgi:hypothetical protein